jgi:hypothetical protein
MKINKHPERRWARKERLKWDKYNIGRPPKLQGMFKYFVTDDYNMTSETIHVSPEYNITHEDCFIFYLDKSQIDAELAERFEGRLDIWREVEGGLKSGSGKFMPYKIDTNN